jgi:hypothetical protein
VDSEGGLWDSTCTMAGRWELIWELIDYPRRFCKSTTTPVSL